MSRDAKWYANWIRILPASTPDEKMRNLEAADMLEQLEAAQPKWISVEERLPENDDNYLVFTSDRNAAEIATYYGDGEWLTHDFINLTPLVTHWMPIPQMPKEDA